MRNATNECARLGSSTGIIGRSHPRSLVPVDRDDIANGFPGRPNPAWDSLDEARRLDLARRMAVFCRYGRDCRSRSRPDCRLPQGDKAIRQHAHSSCSAITAPAYEWGPFGFDGRSRVGKTTLHTGEDLRKIGSRGTHHSYGSGWANLGNTPLRLYKHFTQEGGISTPCIAHWPEGIGTPDKWIRQPSHVMDLMPTLMEVAGATYPDKLHGKAIQPTEGRSLLPAMQGNALPERAIGFDHEAAHALRKGDWKLVWSKRMPREIAWELYNLAEDRCETNDLAKKYPERVKAMAAEWKRWADRVGVTYDRP